jgi:hypothetical protein
MHKITCRSLEKSVISESFRLILLDFALYGQCRTAASAFFVVRPGVNTMQIRLSAALCLVLIPLACAQTPEPAATAVPGVKTTQIQGDELEQAAQNFARAVANSAQFIAHHPYYSDDRSRAAGMAHWTRMMIRTLEEDVILDADYPYFRVVDFRTREGGDNADQRYLIAPLQGGATYRVWGRRGSNRRLEFQLYAGLPWLPSGGRIAAVLASENIKVNGDGSFEVTLSPDAQTGNWLQNPADGSTLMVRQIFSDWSSEIPDEIHIDRVGYTGANKPALSSAAMAQRLNRAARDLETIVPLWPEFVRRTYQQALPANTLTPPLDPAANGGVKDRWMALGHFDLADDEALLVTTWPCGANYQGIQLTDLWFASLEYANAQSSLSADQALLGRDGAYHFVIAARDPGVQNWLDTQGFRQGVILLRYDGMRGKSIAQALWPRAQKIKLDQLRNHLPPGTPHFDEAMRRKALEQRRQHVQRRYGV